MTDYALAVEYLMGVAEYGSAETYDLLVSTWRDERPVPSEHDLEGAWLHVYKDLTKDKVNAIRDLRWYAPTIEYPEGSGHYFDSDHEGKAYSLINDATNKYIEDGITDLPQPWWDTDNVERLYTVIELRGLRDAIATRVLTVQVEARTVKANIESAPDIATIDQIYNDYVNG